MDNLYRNVLKNKFRIVKDNTSNSKRIIMIKLNKSLKMIV